MLREQSSPVSEHTQWTLLKETPLLSHCLKVCEHVCVDEGLADCRYHMDD